MPFKIVRNDLTEMEDIFIHTCHVETVVLMSKVK